MDKQIIIDGCDVSGCEYLYREIDCLAHIDFSECCEGYNPSYGYCPNIDCYYKQLKRKEQECEELNEEIKNLENIRDEFSVKLDQLKAENKELKEKLENYCFDCDVAERMAKVIYAATGGRLSYSNYTVEAIEQAYNDQLCIDVEYRTKELEEELEQYKASKQASYEALQKKCNELELENRKLEADNDILTWQRDEAQKHQYCLAYDETCLKGNEKCIYSTCAFKSIFKLKALVRDIKHIAEDQKDVLESMRIDIAEQILQKISEVLDEEI